MKRTAISLIIGLALVSTGCEQEADVNTVPPDEDPAVSGYRGVDEEPGEPADVEPNAADPDPFTTPRPEDTPQPSLDELRPEPGETGVEDEPAVEEVPAQDLPSDVETPDE